MVEALKEHYDITLFGWDDVDFERINGYYGTTLQPEDLEVRRVPRWPERLRRVLGFRGALLQRYLMLRWGRALAPHFDVTLSVNGEVDVGVRAIQYVHFPWGYLPRPDSDLRWVHRIPGVLRLYYQLGASIAPVSAERIRDNLTLVNSDWTGEKFRQRYGGSPVTLHPPAIAPTEPWAWERRDPLAFLSIGRISPEKELETAIAILERVRAAGHPAVLRLIGGAPVGTPYLARIRALARDRPWIEMHEDIDRGELLALLARSRYGLHAMREEHFGMAVAELAAAGCIPFVPRGGGQLEIVGGDGRLVYDSVDDAAAKIVEVLASPGLQTSLRATLQVRAARFALPEFRARCRALVAQFLAERAADDLAALPAPS
jgi:glycosyltransferase involved in cell wall biosynthesis